MAFDENKFGVGTSSALSPLIHSFQRSCDRVVATELTDDVDYLITHRLAWDEAFSEVST